MKAVRLCSGLAWALTLLVVLVQVVTATPQSVYTRIDRQGCWVADVETDARYASRGLGVQECPAPPGYRLFLVSSDERSWIDVWRDGGGTKWSAERSVVYNSPAGNFPNVAGDEVEWRVESGRATALIFRVVAQVPDEPTKKTSMLYVVALEPGRISLAGRVATIHEARMLADTRAPAQ